jgi:hypothetical protein
MRQTLAIVETIGEARSLGRCRHSHTAPENLAKTFKFPNEIMKVAHIAGGAARPRPLSLCR